MSNERSTLDREERGHDGLSSFLTGNKTARKGPVYQPKSGVQGVSGARGMQEWPSAFLVLCLVSPLDRLVVDRVDFGEDSTGEIPPRARGPIYTGMITLSLRDGDRPIGRWIWHLDWTS